MSLRKSFRACSFFRSTSLGRRGASLCLFVIFFNLLGPIFWVSAHQPLADGIPLCLASAQHENTGGGTTHDNTAIIHCPLCVLLVGSIVAPPSQTPNIIARAHVPREAFRVSLQLPFAQLSPERHPPPRGPPALV